MRCDCADLEYSLPSAYSSVLHVETLRAAGRSFRSRAPPGSLPARPLYPRNRMSPRAAS